ncbi:hypothetical protein [Sphingomonas sp. NFX23]|uniref:hypothetical protein n=1 Tax=Sphingomonas sp. NFX23 TaxID=2819532 RepID=UPI003CED395A
MNALLTDENVSAAFLALGCLTLIFSAVGIFRHSASTEGPTLKVLAAEYRTVLLCFAALFLTLLFIGLSAWWSTPADGSFRRSILQGMTGSLAEDLAFFSLLGFIIVLVQRRENDLNRNLDDKIELLFSAKKLRSGEAAFLRNEVRKISADCQTLSVDIDVIEEDVVNGLIRIDVSRSWLVANYLASESAEYGWKLRISAEDAGGRTPAIFVFPSYTTVMSKNPGGGWQRAADDELLHSGGEVQEHGSLHSEETKLEIAPGQGREFRTRFQGWQPLFMRHAGPPPGAQGPVVPEPDTYRLKMDRHWDEIELSVRNSLKRPIRTTISGSGSRMLEVESGERKMQAYKSENLKADSHVYVSFVLL